MVSQSLLFDDQEFQIADASYVLKTVLGIDIDTARELVRSVGSLHHLAQMPVEMLATYPGIGAKRAAKIKAMTRWALLLQAARFEPQQIIRSVNDAANLVVMDMSLLEKEELRVIVLNTKHNVRCIETVYVGSVNSAMIRVAEVFRSAILHNATSIILAHNHPSGDPTPSPEDVRATELIYETGKSLDIDVLDHMVVGGNRFVSLKERGLAFK